MLFQLNQTLVTLKVEKNQLLPPTSHLLLYGSSSTDIIEASPRQLASPRAKNHSMSGDILNPSPQTPSSFSRAGFLLQSLNAELMGPVDFPQGTFGSMNQEKHRCENKVHMALCIRTVPGLCRGHGYPSQVCRSLPRHPWRRRSSENSACRQVATGCHHARITALVLCSIKRLCHNKPLTLPPLEFCTHCALSSSQLCDLYQP